jgi:hypothetical protein
MFERKGNPGKEEGVEEDERTVAAREVRSLLFDRKGNAGKARRSGNARVIPRFGRMEFRTAKVYQGVTQEKRKRRVAANLQITKEV